MGYRANYYSDPLCENPTGGIIYQSPNDDKSSGDNQNKDNAKQEELNKSVKGVDVRYLWGDCINMTTYSLKVTSARRLVGKIGIILAVFIALTNQF